MRLHIDLNNLERPYEMKAIIDAFWKHKYLVLGFVLLVADRYIAGLAVNITNKIGPHQHTPNLGPTVEYICCICALLFLIKTKPPESLL